MPKARRSDPSTSKAAAMSISATDLTETKRNILILLKEQAMTDEILVAKYNDWAEFLGIKWASPSGIRSRRAELVDAGLVMDTGDRIPSKSGRMMIVWKAI